MERKYSCVKTVCCYSRAIEKRLKHPAAASENSRGPKGMLIRGKTRASWKTVSQDEAGKLKALNTEERRKQNAGRQGD